MMSVCVWEVVVKPLMVNLYYILILLDGLTFENRWRCGVMAWNERMANCRSSERRMRGWGLSGHACMAVQEMGAGVQLRPVSDLVFHKAWDLQQCGGGATDPMLMDHQLTKTIKRLLSDTPRKIKLYLHGSIWPPFQFPLLLLFPFFQFFPFFVVY